MGAMMPEHLAHMTELERSGVLFASGPFLDPDGRPGDALSIIHAPSKARATAIAGAEPLVKAGVRTFEVRQWRLTKGTPTLLTALYGPR
jgi:uncharacterized protein